MNVMKTRPSLLLYMVYANHNGPSWCRPMYM